MSKTSIALAAIVIGVVLGATPVVGQVAADEPSPSATDALATSVARIVAVETLDARTRDLTIESPSVGTVQVRLLLPEGFEDGSEATYPVLYLLHGGGGSYADWTEETDVESITASSGLLVAMPAAASTNLGTWLPQGGPDGLGGPPNWERFHLRELPGLLADRWQAGERRVVAGLSLGGYGAVMYAARHPRLFRAAASYSGVLDVSVDASGDDSIEAIVDRATEIAESHGWDEANPINLVPALVETELYISYGNGAPGPLDPAGTEQDQLEEWVGLGDDNFAAALAESDIPATLNAYGPGTHSWSYWERELEASLPTLLEAVAEERDPSS